MYRGLLLTLRNPNAAAEAVDEAMRRALERWDVVGTYEHPDRWVYRVAYNRAVSIWRKTRREAFDILVEPSLEDGLPDPDVSRALARLAVHWRSVVVARYYLDWSTEITADALGIAEGTVKSCLSRAIKRLEAELGEQI